MKKNNKLLKDILETQIEEIRKQNKDKKKERGSYINQIVMIMLGLSVIVGLIYSFVKLF
ncbi:hypothetical protein [Gemella sp.]